MPHQVSTREEGAGLEWTPAIGCSGLTEGAVMGDVDGAAMETMAGAVSDATAGPDMPPPSRRPRVLLGFTGSVASIKAVQLVTALRVIADVKVIATAAARHFFQPADLPLDPADIYGDEDEWQGLELVRFSA